MRWFSTCAWMMCLALSGCVTAGNVNPSLARQIPEESKAIRLYSSDSPPDYFKVIYRTLAEQGFSIAQENADMGTMTTDFKDIGEQTSLRVNVFVQAVGGKTVATLRGKWGLTSMGSAGLAMTTGIGGISVQEDASWGTTGRPQRAFGELAMIADRIEKERVEYLTR